MPYQIDFAAPAKEDLRALRVTDRTRVLDLIERHLTHQPMLQSRSRIKALRLGTFPPYRLRVNATRVYYDVDEANGLVIVLGIVPKAHAAEWLARMTARHRQGER